MFDGVHRGHRALLAEVTATARRLGLTAGAVTFDRHPLEVLRPDVAPPLLSTLADRIALLRGAGLDWVAVLRFNRERAAQTAEEFAERVLFDRLSARAIVVGENFRFGNRAAGDVALLERLGGPRGIEVTGIGLAAEGGQVLSSTAVRNALAEGDVATAALVLGRPYAVTGRVAHGDGRGRGLGVPTANLRLPARLLVPARGIYAGRLHAPGADGRGPLPAPAAAVTSVGVNPTFGGTRLRVEAHVLGTDDVRLYGRRATLTFTHRLRGEVRYDRVEDLVAQMHADIAHAGRLLLQDGGPVPILERGEP
jgi:riboflavin kinase/FMN adenylyltransferase